MKKSVKSILKACHVESLDVGLKRKILRGVAEHISFDLRDFRLNCGLSAFPFAAAFLSIEGVVKYLSVVAEQRNGQDHLPCLRQSIFQPAFRSCQLSVTGLCLLQFLWINCPQMF